MKIFIVRDMQWHKFKNNFYSTLLTQLNCITFVTKKEKNRDKTSTKEEWKRKKEKRDLNFCGAFNLLFCDVAHIFWCGFSHFVIYCVVLFLYFAYAHLSFTLVHSTYTCCGIIWIDRKIWQILVPLHHSHHFSTIIRQQLIKILSEKKIQIKNWNYYVKKILIGIYVKQKICNCLERKKEFCCTFRE